MRDVKLFEELDRRDIANNLYCYYCGNTNQWQMDIRVQYIVENADDGIAFQMDPVRSKRILDAVQRNVNRMINHSNIDTKPIFHCANCGNDELEVFEAMQENCWNMGCPGCDHCCNWIDEDELRNLCSSCIEHHQGKVDEDHCFNLCPHYDFGLEQVRQHYAITLDELIREAGY